MKQKWQFSEEEPTAWMGRELALGAPAIEPIARLPAGGMFYKLNPKNPHRWLNAKMPVGCNWSEQGMTKRVGVINGVVDCL